MGLAALDCCSTKLAAAIPDWQPWEEKKRRQQDLNDPNPAKCFCRTLAGNVLCELEIATEALGSELAQTIMGQLDGRNYSLQLLIGNDRLEKNKRLRDQSVVPDDAVELLVLVQR